MPENNPEDTFWWRLVNLNPALYRALIMAVVLVLSSFGILISDAIPDSLILLVTAVLAIAQGIWTRRDVTPNAKVIAYTNDPQRGGTMVYPGMATTTAGVDNLLHTAQTVGSPKAPWPVELRSW